MTDSPVGFDVAPVRYTAHGRQAIEERVLDNSFPLASSQRRLGWLAYMSQQTEGFHRAPQNMPGTDERSEWEAGWALAQEHAGQPMCGLMRPKE